MACREASCATICAAYAVLLREPLKPTLPALDHPITLPFRSVIVTTVLLKVASTCATPECTFLLPLALTIFGLSTSSVERERLSGAPAAGAGCSFFGFAVFFSAGRFVAAASAFGAAF